MKNINVIRGKSGILGSAISNFMSYLVFIFVVMIFFVFFNIQASEIKENKIEGLERETMISLELDNFLRIPVTVDVGGEIKRMTIADLIVDYVVDGIFDTGSYQNVDLIDIFKMDILKSEFPVPPFKRVWRLRILLKKNTPNAELICELDTVEDRLPNLRCTSASSITRIYSATVILPMPRGVDGYQQIEVILDQSDTKFIY